MRIHKYIIVALIYFFFNAVGLPFGLTYMGLLCIFFYHWIIKESGREILLPFITCMAIFAVPHLAYGVNKASYVLSLLNYTTVYIFGYAFFLFIKKSKDPATMFNTLLYLNFLFCIVALSLYFTPYYQFMWMEHDITRGVENVRRLKMFTYEASYYALLFTPLFFYFLLKLVFKRNSQNCWLILLMIVLPYLLSFSLGTMVACLVALLVVGLLYSYHLFLMPRVRHLLLIFAGCLFVALIGLYFFFPSNDLFARLGNIFSGDDTSGKGRTVEAFYLARQILELKNPFWGVGPGQIKILGADIVRSYYLYDLDYNNIAIPNAVAETLAIFGWIGLTLRFVIELALFVFSRCWTNYFRFLLFVFIFVYQFTGSFITNIAEYVIWILAFTKAFPQFDVQRRLVTISSLKIVTT